MASTTTSDNSLHRGTNWWGAFVIGLAGTILVTGIAPFAVQSLGAASIPLFVVITAMGVLLCFCLAELAAMMPHRTGGLPSYAFETFKPLGETTAKHAGGISGWGYWLGWFTVAPINMFLASGYIIALFKIPTGPEYNLLGDYGSSISVAALVISVVGLLVMFVPSYLGIHLGAGFATVLGVVSMAPLTALVLLPVFKPGSADFGNLSGFHLPEGVTGSLPLWASWIFVMTWSVLAMEAAACYIGECRDPHRDAKIAMTAEGLYGFFIYVMTPVMFVAVLGATTEFDPLTVYTDFTAKVFGSSGSWVQYVIGIPLIVALMLSVLNAIMGCGRSLYQIAEDGLLPKWFHHLNKNKVPGHAMVFNLVCSLIVVSFGSPLRIYVFSNVGYLLAVGLSLIGYFLYRQYRPEVHRPLRMPGWMRWAALGTGIFFLVVWVYGGWHSPAVVVAADQGSFLFWLGIAIVATYLPLYWWRQRSGGHEPATIDLASAEVGTVDLTGQGQRAPETRS